MRASCLYIGDVRVEQSQNQQSTEVLSDEKTLHTRESDIHAPLERDEWLMRNAAGLQA